MGGAILDSCVRFLDEDPWQRLETFAQTVGDNRKIMALMRGATCLPTSLTRMIW
jgi:methylmalonyl-CoA carboxyltransferase 5S subunit